MTRPDLFPDGEGGFALDHDLADSQVLRLITIITLFAVALILACFFWLDRPAMPKITDRVAVLEQPQGGRP